MSYVNNEMITNALNGQPVHNILNAVHDEATQYYQNNVTRASVENISATGQGINSNPALQNEFIRLLMTGLVPIALSSPNLHDDFTEFRGERIPFGKTLYEVATDVIDPIEFNMYQSEFKSKEIFVPKVATRFYVNNRKDQFPVTVSKVLLMGAFESEASFMAFLRSIIQNLHESNERAKYKYTLLSLSEYYAKNHFHIVEAPNVLEGTVADSEKFIETIERLTLEMGLGDGSREFNNQGLVTRTTTDGLHLFITPALLARVKIGVWAKVFNLGEAEFKPKVHVIRGFEEHPEVQAILCDKDFFRIHPNFEEMTEEVNNRGLYSTFYYTCFDTYGLSDFKNAIVITSSEITQTVYDVVIPVSNADIRRGESVTYDALIRKVERDETDHKIVWTVEKPNDGVSLASGTKFNGAVLSIDKLEKNTLLTVKATVTVGELAAQYTVTGLASVNVVK